MIQLDVLASVCTKIEDILLICTKTLKCLVYYFVDKYRILFKIVDRSLVNVALGK